MGDADPLPSPDSQGGLSRNTLPDGLASIVDSLTPTLLLHLTAALVLLTVLFRPIYDSDLPWQLKTGELILDSSRVPSHEPFLADKADEPFVPVAWAGQATYAFVRRIGGWPLLHVLDGLLWVSGFLAVGLSVRRSGLSVWAVAGTVALAHLVAFSSVSTRPQTFAIACFGLLIALVRSPRPGWLHIVLGAALLVAWQNLHPSAAVGAVWIGGAAVAVWIRRFLAGGPSPWAITGLALLAPFAVIATPAGFGLLRVSAYNADISLWFGISEWLPLWELDPIRFEVWTGLIVTCGLVAWRPRRFLTVDFAPAVILLVMAVLSYRFVMFWAVAMIPVWAGIVAPTVVHVAGSDGRRPYLPAAVAWIVAIAVPSAWNPSHLADYFPFAAVEKLRSERSTGTVYCDSVWAGVVIDAGYPNWRVSHDGRYYLRSKEEWSVYFAAATGKVPIAELQRRWNPVAFVLRTGPDDGLIALLRKEAGWVEWPADRECVVFVRGEPR